MLHPFDFFHFLDWLEFAAFRLALAAAFFWTLYKLIRKELSEPPPRQRRNRPAAIATSRRDAN